MVNLVYWDSASATARLVISASSREGQVEALHCWLTVDEQSAVVGNEAWFVR